MAPEQVVHDHLRERQQPETRKRRGTAMLNKAPAVLIPS